MGGLSSGFKAKLQERERRKNYAKGAKEDKIPN
jgi:hypothetical protein